MYPREPEYQCRMLFSRILESSQASIPLIPVTIVVQILPRPDGSGVNHMCPLLLRISITEELVAHRLRSGHPHSVNRYDFRRLGP